MESLRVMNGLVKEIKAGNEPRLPVICVSSCSQKTNKILTCFDDRSQDNHQVGRVSVRRGPQVAGPVTPAGIHGAQVPFSLGAKHLQETPPGPSALKLYVLFYVGF